MSGDDDSEHAQVERPDVTVSREDVAIGEASEADLSAADTDPVADESAENLCDRLRADAPPERQRAALALAERDPPGSAIDALADRAENDPDETVRQFAVEALGRVVDSPPEAVISALDDPDPWVRAEAIVALDRQGQVERIADAVADDHHAVRRNAAISLWKRRGEDVLDQLLALADDDSDRVREWVAHLLGQIDDPDARQALSTLQSDDSSVVAKTATHALADSGTKPGPPGGTQFDGTDPTGSQDRPPQL